MSDQKQKPTLMFALIAALVLVLAAGAYFSFAKKGAAPVAEPVMQTEATAPAEETTSAEPIVSGDVPPQPETPQNVVVETKKLEVPATTESQAPAEVAPVASSADVEALMAPRSIGNADAPIKVTEFASLTCSHCAAFHNNDLPQFKTKFIDTGKVQLTFKEFPLNPPALDASMIARCLPEDRYVSFTDLLFQQQDNWAYKPEYKDFLRQNAKLAGMTDEQFDSCLANEGLKNRIVGDMKAATEKYKIQSTPSFVVNDGKKVLIGHQPMDAFEKAFEEVGGTAPAATTQQPAAQ